MRLAIHRLGGIRSASIHGSKSRRPLSAALVVACTVAINSWPVLKTIGDDKAPSAASRVAEQKFDETFFDARRDPSAEAAQARLSPI